MTREQMMIYMDLLDDTFIEEANPKNSKNRKRKQFHTAMMRFCAAAACLLLMIGGVFYLMRDLAHTVTPPITTEEIIFEVKPQGYVHFDKSLEECITEADYIVRGTVSEIKAAVLEDGYELSSETPDEALRQAIQKIYTPVSFVPQKIYKSAAIASLAELVPQINYPLSLKCRYGTYEGYRLSPMDTQIILEENREYILFLYVNNAGYLSVWHQPSLVIRDDGTFSSLMSNALYDNFENVDEVLAFFETLVSE